MTQMVKNPSAMWETWVRSLGWEDPLEKGMATHSSLLAWKIPRTEEPGRLQSLGWQRVSDFHFTNSGTSWQIGQFQNWVLHLNNLVLQQRLVEGERPKAGKT